MKRCIFISSSNKQQKWYLRLQRHLGFPLLSELQAPLPLHVTFKQTDNSQFGPKNPAKWKDAYLFHLQTNNKNDTYDCKGIWDFRYYPNYRRHCHYMSHLNIWMGLKFRTANQYIPFDTNNPLKNSANLSIYLRSGMHSYHMVSHSYFQNTRLYIFIFYNHILT